MKVSEKINYLLEEKNMSKREFARKLLSLEPKLDRTGKAPSESTIYGYLNGGREIKIELIPYIADVLKIKEQDLFEFDIEYSTGFNQNKSQDVREIIALLEYLPNNAIKNLKNKLYKYKKIYEDDFDL